MNFIVDKRGFTMIELLAAVVIITLLVFISADNYFDKKEEADIMQIESDVLVYETMIKAEIIKNKNYLEESDFKVIKVNSIDLDAVIYDSEDEYDGGFSERDVLYSLPKELGESTLKGEFFYSKINDRAYYYSHSRELEKEEQEKEEESEEEEEKAAYYLAKDSDFEWVVAENIASPYKAVNESGRGYYKYIGKEKRVEIPEYIKGTKMTSYTFMFSEAEGVSGVKSTSKDIKDIKYMFFKVNTEEEIDLSEFNFEGVVDANSAFKMAKADKVKIENVNFKSLLYGQEMFMGSSIGEVSLKYSSMRNLYSSSSMFKDSKVKKVNLTGLNMSSVEYAYSFFYGWEGEDIKLENFKLSDSFDGHEFFYNIKSENLELSFSDNFFRGALKLNKAFSHAQVKSINLENQDLANTQSIAYMFYEARLEHLNVKGLNAPKAKSAWDLFSNAKIGALDIGEVNIADSANLEDSFNGSQINKVDISGINLSKASNINNLFKNARIKVLVFGKQRMGFSTDKARSFVGAFNGAKIEIIDMSEVEIGPLLEVSANGRQDIFNGLNSIKELDIRKINVLNIRGSISSSKVNILEGITASQTSSHIHIYVMNSSLKYIEEPKNDLNGKIKKGIIGV